MEIALVLDRFDPLHGGLEHWASQLACWLRDQGHRIHIVTGNCPEDAAAKEFVVHRLGWKSRLAFAEDAERCLRTLHVDIVHDLGSGWFFDVFQPQFGSRLADARQNLRALSLIQRWRKLLSRAQWRRWQAMRSFEDRQYRSGGGRIIAVSRMTEKDLRHFHRIPADRLSVIPNGVDPEKFSLPARSAAGVRLRPTAHLESKTVLLLAAHNFRLKGLSTLLRALARLRAEPLHALIVGRDDVPVYQRLAERLQVTQQVTFCGFVDDIREYYAAADVYVHPTFYDPCSLAVLEALSCGLPVITSRFNGASELMKPGVQGLILQNPNSPGELAVAIRKLLDPRLRESMAGEARSLALRNSADKCFAEILALYGEVLARKQGRNSGAWK